jgi:predicted transposase YbfD/YdcC
MIAFSTLPDPRRTRNRLYTLEDLICTSILATICTCDDYYEISEWTDANLDWLQSLGLCLEGSPSHDTYERFFRHLDAKKFQDCFVEWAQLLRGKLGKTIAIDGKTLCNSHDGDSPPLHLVSAFATDSSLILGQLKTNGKGGELAGIQKLLEILDIKGAVITIDAAGCHKVVTEKIVERGGDYLICLKGNQGLLHAEVENFFSQAVQVEPVESGCIYSCVEERAKGRFEKREVWSNDDIDWIPQKDQWKGLCSIVCVKRTTIDEEKKTEETRYFISSIKANAEHQGRIIRSHWGIENNLHWQLDVTYREDLARVRKGNGAENLSVLRRTTMNILQSDVKSKASLKRRRLRASWRRDYLLELMGVN